MDSAGRSAAVAFQMALAQSEFSWRIHEMPVIEVLAAFNLAAAPVAIASMSDAKLCATLEANAKRDYEGKAIGPAFISKAGADCQAKQVFADFFVSTNPSEFPAYVDTFMASANKSVCESKDPVVRHFLSRGWTYRYSFTSAVGETVNKRLTCSR
jgi:hypothetical protein